MYICPNCASNLKFDIASRMLRCEHCGTTADPYGFEGGKEAEEHSKEYEVTVFTCPQCGGEILSEDTTAATFCSFCGASTILNSRVSKEHRPAHIIPFSKTKEDCKAAYARMMRRAVFAPDALKHPEHIEKFRGIYMPYWVYSFEKNGRLSVPGTKSYRRGDYVYTNHFQLDCELNSAYQGLSYDASASFSDNLSSAIAPFQLKDGQPFTPAYLSGFYADTNDVEKWVYQDEAEDMVVKESSGQLLRKCRPYHVSSYSLKNAVRPTTRKAELAMLPVWFLSYRNGDRVSYAVVNGQTGKVAADIPIDPKKYAVGSAILAVPFFILLNLLFTFTPAKALFLAMILAIVSIFISNSQISKLFVKESGGDDKGLSFIKQRQQKGEDLAQRMADGREAASKKKRESTMQRTGSMVMKSMMMMIGMILLIQLCIPLLIRGMLRGGAAVARITPLLTVLIIMSPFFIFRVISGKNRESLLGKPRRGMPSVGFKQKLPVLWKPLAGIVLAVLILILQPVHDGFYYMGTILCFGMVLWSFMDIIQQYNELTTRRLPQFNSRGGDGNAS